MSPAFARSLIATASLVLCACASDPPSNLVSARLNTAPPCADFQRSADGGWTAVNDTSITGMHGQVPVVAGTVVKPGEYLEGVDVAWGLDRFCR
jgi:hypothetical protein